jgi:hypothetical protein
MMSEQLTETDDVLVPGPPLTPREELFVRAFCDPESSTYGKATKSAELARYSEPHNAQWRLRHRPRIIQRIGEYEKLVRVEIGKILSDLEHTRLQALAAGDWSTATRCSELQGKHLAMWTDKVAVDKTYVHVYDERAAIDARKITRILLLGSVEQGPLLLDAPPGPAVAAAVPAPALLQDTPPARATPEQIERAQAPRTRQGE